MDTKTYEKQILKFIILTNFFLFTQCSSTKNYNYGNQQHESDMDKASSEIRKRQESEIIKFDYRDNKRNIPHNRP
ncbi:hypothetical protein [Chryseobacterium viscerum]|uniref:Uncharacterized protein n=1 Tax=Chryseobacterium viscerum TaxID=1037377 RepID=A0A316WAT1_9FLAO|nr:hypothetical protein [Chryseobacterium viscerum]PWN58401.1 hypothetical protein C1634_022880 [Chryseobacterium viscerum]